MTLETLFQLTNLAIPFWLIMILGGWWRGTVQIMRSPYVAIVPAIVYAVLVVPQMGSIFAAVSNPTVESIAALLGTPEGATIAWAHFLAFDLLVGRWAYLNSQEMNIPWWLISPILVFVLMVGPVGFLMYLVLRAVYAGIRQAPADALLDPALTTTT